MVLNVDLSDIECYKCVVLIQLVLNPRPYRPMMDAFVRQTAACMREAGVSL